MGQSFSYQNNFTSLLKSTKLEMDPKALRKASGQGNEMLRQLEEFINGSTVRYNSDGTLSIDVAATFNDTATFNSAVTFAETVTGTQDKYWSMPRTSFAAQPSIRAEGDTDTGIGVLTTDPDAFYIWTGGTARWGLDVSGHTYQTGWVTAESGGVDGGIVLGQTFSTSYIGVRTVNMSPTAATEYILISTGSSTYFGSGTGGSTYIRGPGNGSSPQLQLDGTTADMDGPWRVMNQLKFGATDYGGLNAGMDTYGTVSTTGTGKGAWEGYSINGDFVFMSNSTDICGIYDDTLNGWFIYYDGNGFFRIHDTDTNGNNHVAFGGNDATTNTSSATSNGLVGISDECGGFSGTAAHVTTTTVAGVTMKRLGFLSSYESVKWGIERLDFSDDAFMALRPVTFFPNDTFVLENGQQSVFAPDDVHYAQGRGLMPLRRIGFVWDDLMQGPHADETMGIATDYSYDYGALCAVLVDKLQDAMKRIDRLEKMVN